MPQDAVGVSRNRPAPFARRGGGAGGVRRVVPDAGARRGRWGTRAAVADRPQGAPSLQPAAVPSATDPFTLVPPAGAACEADGEGRSGADGWRWHTFIVEADRDLSTLEFGGTGPGTDFDATDGQITVGLIVSGRGVFNEPPAEQPKGLINPNSLAGLVLDPAAYGLVDGGYLIGFACTDDASAIRQWWSLEVTVQTAAAPFMTTATGPGAMPTDAAGVTSTTSAAGAVVTDPGSTTTVAPAVSSAAATAVTTSSTDEAAGSPTGVSWSPLVALSDASSVLPVAVWAVLVVVLGRIAYLLSRPVRILPPIAP